MQAPIHTIKIRSPGCGKISSQSFDKIISYFPAAGCAPMVPKVVILENIVFKIASVASLLRNHNKEILVIAREPMLQHSIGERGKLIEFY